MSVSHDGKECAIALARSLKLDTTHQASAHACRLACWQASARTAEPHSYPSRLRRCYERADDPRVA